MEPLEADWLKQNFTSTLNCLSEGPGQPFWKPLSSQLLAAHYILPSPQSQLFVLNLHLSSDSNGVSTEFNSGQQEEKEACRGLPGQGLGCHHSI